MKVNFKQNYQQDYPKRYGDMSLAWYRQGQICVIRQIKEHKRQPQNIYIREINAVVHLIWQNLSIKVKKELQEYACSYKRRYPLLRKRGNNAYSVFLVICHTLIKKYQLSQLTRTEMASQLKVLLSSLSVYQLVLCGVLKLVKMVYQLHQSIYTEKENLLLNQNCGRIISSIGSETVSLQKDIVAEFSLQIRLNSS